MPDEEEWFQILSEIADGFEAHGHLKELDWMFQVDGEWVKDEAQKFAWEKTVEEGMHLFVRFYDHLWD